MNPVDQDGGSEGERSSTMADLLEALGESLPDPLYLLDAGGGVVAMNRAAETLNESLSLGRELPRQVEGIVQTEMADPMEAAPPCDKPFIFPLQGRERFFLPRLVKMQDGEGGAVSAAVLLSDITQLQLREGIEKNLVSAVSHEIRTPLTSIQMAIYILLEQSVGVLNPTQAQLLETARTECQRLLETLNTLLAMVHGETEDKRRGRAAGKRSSVL